jgi:hypothetical protein
MQITKYHFSSETTKIFPTRYKNGSKKKKAIYQNLALLEDKEKLY